MRKIKNIVRLDFSYDGSLFRGFQKQNGQRTVQGEIERTLLLVYKQPIEVFAAGRTDTGVHAMHQVVSFDAPSTVHIPVEKLPITLNSLLPPDIRIWHSKNEGPSFHARFSAKSRMYQYVIHNTTQASPFDYKQKWYYPYPLDEEKMQLALNHIVGEHHFGSFTEKPSTKNLIRTIYKAEVKRQDELIFITIHGNAFLRRMIRVIVGSISAIGGYSHTSPQQLADILSYKDRNQNPYPTAPAQGLYFYRVEY